MTRLEGATVAVTGATGFIGRYIVEALRSRGAKVRAVARRPESARALFGPEVDVRTADLADEPALAAAFDGADAVVSNAAVISVAAGNPSALVEANVEGVSRTFRALVAAGVRRAVHMSTAVAYRPKRGHFYREDDPLYPPETRRHPFNAYGVSKAAGEQQAWALCAQHGVALSTCRPHTVFGWRDRGTFTKWFLRFVRPPVSLFPAYLQLPSVYAGDLAEAVCRMLERDAAKNRAYHVCTDPDAVSYWQLLRAYREAGGRIPAVVVPVPVPLRRRYATDRMRQDLELVLTPPAEAFRRMLAEAETLDGR